MSHRFVGLGALAGICVSAASVAGAQPLPQPDDPYPALIPQAPGGLEFIEFATLPDSAGAPARMNLMTDDPLGRLFVNDQRGLLYRVANDGSSVSTYLDLANGPGIDLTFARGELGFQSFAFHPDFAAPVGAAGRGKLYTIHSDTDLAPTPTFDPGGPNAVHSVLLEWTTADPGGDTFTATAAPRELMRLEQPYDNHNAGMIGFNSSANPGADRGNLYISMGDGGFTGDPLDTGEDRSNPYGGLMRIDPLGSNSDNGQYGIVADNVLAADTDSGTLAELYATGFRNPQRFGWDDDGRMFLGDIGQELIEEVNLVVNGGNYGWDVQEGSFNYEGTDRADLIDPAAEYDHDGTFVDPSLPNRAITIGDVVRGSGIDAIDGQLMLGDFPNGILMVLDVDTDPLNGGQDGLTELLLLDDSGDPIRLLDLINATRAKRYPTLGNTSRADLRFSTGLDGQLFLLNKRDGVIRQVVPEPGVLAMLAPLGVIALRHRRRA